MVLGNRCPCGFLVLTLFKRIKQTKCKSINFRREPSKSISLH